MLRGHTCKVEAAKADKARQEFEDKILVLKAYKKGERVMKATSISSNTTTVTAWPQSRLIGDFIM